MKTQNTKNTTMKTTLNFVIVAFVALALTFSTTSCKKSNEDPAPAPSNNGGNNGNPNIAPAFDAISATVVSDGSAKSFSLPVHDADGNTITISSIAGASSNVTITKTGLNVTVTPNTTVYAGVETLTITITDGTTPTTATFTVNVGSSDQTSSYSKLSPYFTQTLGGNFKIRPNGVISSDADGDFYESGATSASYKIISNGNILMSVNGVDMEYSIATPTANNLELTLVSTTNSSFNAAVGTAFLF